MKYFAKIIAFIIVAVLLSGCNSDGKFALKSKMTGTLADAVATNRESGGRYQMQIDVTTRWVYNLIRGKRHERYRSVGDVKNGIYYSHKLTIERWTEKNHLHSINEYSIDYRKKRIIRHYREWHGKKLVKESKVDMGYFTHDDFLTVLHNTLLRAKVKSTQRINKLVAASEETKGKVSIFISKDPKQLARWGVPKDGMLVQMDVHKSIFKGSKGYMTVLLDAKSHPIKFYLQNLKTINTMTGIPKK